MKIRISGLKPGRNELAEVIQPSDLKLDPVLFQRPVNVRVAADKTGGKISIIVQTTGTSNCTCDRCDDDFTMETSGNCQVVYIQRDEPLPDEEPGDDLRSYGPMQEFIDLSAEARDALMLALPWKFLCREDCLGLCAKCGANLNLGICKCGKSD
jgi:uncharacterized protein